MNMDLKIGREVLIDTLLSVIGNLTAVINGFGNSGFAGLLALFFLVGLYKK